MTQKRKIAVCIDCTHSKEIVALGRCQACYMAVYQGRRTRTSLDEAALRLRQEAQAQSAQVQP